MVQQQAQSGRNGRRCRRCGDPIRWGEARLVGSRTFCSEACAILSLADEAQRTAWARTVLELNRGGRGVRHRAALVLARGRAALAQRRLDRRLKAGPRAMVLPWIWVPPRAAAASLLLVLVAWGATGGGAPRTQATFPPGVTVANLILTPATPAPGGGSPSPPLAPPQPRSAPSALEPAPLSLPPAAPPRVGPLPRPWPTPAPVAEDVTRGHTAIREIAFTFDGGDEANANVADDILAALRARGVRVTMFLTGQFIRAFPDLVRRIVSDGHEVGNHLDTHPHLTTYAQNRRHRTLSHVTREFVTDELRRAEASFRAATGQPMAPYWRAPYGEHNAEIRAWAAEAGYRHISWTRGAGTAEDLDTRDWVADRSSRIYRSREEIRSRILEFGRGRPEGLNGGIVLMHLATRRQTDRPHEGLPSLLQALQAQGYRLVTVSELLDQVEPRQARALPTATPQPPSGGRVLVR